LDFRLFFLAQVVLAALLVNGEQCEGGVLTSEIVDYSDSTTLALGIDVSLETSDLPTDE
jgi:hypothetical protein